MMVHYGWICNSITVIIFCITISQQKVTDVRKRDIKIAKSVTKIASYIVEGKKKLAKNIQSIAPNAVVPIVEALDPDWFTGINYTRWVVDMEDALQDRNTELWAKTLKNRFDIPRVVEEIKTSKITKATCLACKFLLNLLRYMEKSGKSDRDILKLAAKMCTKLQIQTERVCLGIMNLIGIDVVQVVKESDMTVPQICSFALSGTCLNGNDPRHEWKVTFPPVEKVAKHLTSPSPDSSPVIKVLQISDTHYDPYYLEGSNADCAEPLCCRETDGLPATLAVAAGKWGDYRKCDTPKRLFESALKHMSDTHKDLDYILWTGDIPAHDIWNQTREENLKNLRESAELMATYFNGIPIFPSVGNHESCPVDSFAPPSAPPRKNMSWLYDELNNEWSRWLPAHTSETIKLGAFYSTLVKPGFRIISVNGNFCSKNNFWLIKNSTDPLNELAWLINELQNAEDKGEKVHIIGHIPPGTSDCLKVWSKNYYDIINRYEATVMAQFYGHTHYDEFSLFYDTTDFKRPVGIGFIAPSITPWENVNPAYRIYYVDGDHPTTTRAIIDHETWKVNLDKANSNGKAVWYKAYNARTAYNMSSALPKDWDNLITQMTKDQKLFEIYYRNYYRNSPVRPKCDDVCRRTLLCKLRSGRSYDEANLCRDL